MRTLIMRQLKGLENAISISICSPIKLKHGFTFEEYPGSIPDSINHCQYLYQVYTANQHDYTGRASVPVLWDKFTN